MYIGLSYFSVSLYSLNLSICISSCLSYSTLTLFFLLIFQINLPLKKKMVAGNTHFMKWTSSKHLFKYSSYVHHSWYAYNVSVTSTRLYYCIFYYINSIIVYYSWLQRGRHLVYTNIVQSHYLKNGCIFYNVYAMVLSNYIQYG